MKDIDAGNKKAALVILIIIFVISIVIAVTGSVKKFIDLLEITQEETLSSNTTQPTNFYQDGKLNFFDGSNLLGTYTCTGSYCNWAYEKIDDKNYNVQFYDDGKIDLLGSLINNRYAFITDSKNNDAEDPYHYDDGVKLYDVVNSKVVDEYVSVKNYSSNLQNNSFIVQNKEGKWGVINLNDNVVTSIDFQYDYIGLFYIDSESQLSSVDTYIAYQSGNWVLLDISGQKVSTSFSDSIVGYQKEFVITYNSNNKYSIYTKDGEKINEEDLEHIVFSSTKYIALYNFNRLVVYDSESKNIIKTLTDQEIENAEFVREGNDILLKINDQEVERYNI